MERYSKPRSYKHPPAAQFNPKSDVSESGSECPLSEKAKSEIRKRVTISSSNSRLFGFHLLLWGSAIFQYLTFLAVE